MHETWVILLKTLLVSLVTISVVVQINMMLRGDS